MNTLNPNIPNAELARLMTTAAGNMGQYKIKLLTPQLLLMTFLAEQESAAYQILQQLRQQRGFDWDDFGRRVEMMAQYTQGQDAQFNFTDDFGKDIPLADEMLVVLDEGLTIAQAREELKVGSGHALAAMAQHNVTTYAVLNRIGVTPAAVTALLGEVAQNGTPILHDFIQEAKEGKTLPVYQRTALLQEMLNLLALAQGRHMILVGPEGAGKRTLGYSLAQLLAENKGPGNIRSFVQLSETALLENPLAAMRAGLRRASGGILFVPGVDRFFGDRLRAKFPEQVNRELHKALVGDEQVIIGTATPAAYDLLNQERLIRERTHRLDVPAMTREETTALIGFHKRRLEQEYEIEVSPDALETAVNLAGQYIKTTVLPASAVQLADRASAMVSMVSKGHPIPLENIHSDGRMDSEDVMVAASQITKIPIAKLSQDEQGRYANMVEHLHERIIGQEEAILAVSRAVKTARVGLRDPKRPIGSFLFLGPSGVGKSELAKTLAEFMFGSEDAMLTLDMSEYQEEASVNRLIGAPPGYVGFEGGGQLTDFVRQKPYTVVLFDEVEKAHPRVLDVLLQVMDEGRLTDGQGRLTTFSETVLIMTSNLGAYHMLTPVIGDQERELVMAEVRHFFRPEFLNRLDDIILFHQLRPDQLSLILDLMLKKEFKQAEKQGIRLSVDEDARKWLLAQNDQPEFGARPLRRIISRYLREPLADFLLQQTSSDSVMTVNVGVDGDGLRFERNAAK
ncbi:MAG: ATP-dependent Clp protease ATP-binding subunit [Candidatus Promineifilaceae bacterium]